MITGGARNFFKITAGRGQDDVVWHHHNVHSAKTLFDSCVEHEYLEMNFSGRSLKEESSAWNLILIVNLITIQVISKVI